MIDPELDLDIATLTRACRGDVSKLPTFMVHNDDAWPWHAKVRVDKNNRIHIRRSTFNRTVAKQLPVKESLWLRSDAQLFLLDLKPHHVQGGEDTTSDAKKTARVLARADEAGRMPDEADHGTPIDPKPFRGSELQRDLAEIEKRDGKKSVRSTALLGDSDSE